MEVLASEREAFLQFVELNAALSSMDDDLLSATANERVILIDLLSHDFNNPLRALYVARVLRNYKGYRLVGVTGSLLLSKVLKFPYDKNKIQRLARSFGVDEFIDLEQILAQKATSNAQVGAITPEQTERVLAQARACEDDKLAELVLSWTGPDDTKVGDYIHDTTLRISRNPVFAEGRELLEQVTREAHALYNAIDAFCRTRMVEVFIASHMVYTQWGIPAEMVLRRKGRAIWFDPVGSFAAYLVDRPPVGTETICGLIRKAEHLIFEEMFENRHKLDARFVAKVKRLFLSNQFLTPYWWRTTRSPSKPLMPTLRAIARKKLGWGDADRPVVCVFLHCFADGARDDEAAHRDYYIWMVESLKIAAADTSKRWIFKLHPANKGTYDITNRVDLLEAEYADQPHIRFLDNELHKTEIFALCDLAVTVRGSVSYEFSMFGTPTLLAGRSFQSDMGFCHIADDAAQYETLLTSRFNELEFTTEMRERVDFYILYDRAIGRVESTFMPFYGSLGEGSIWKELIRRVQYNINDLDPAALALREMIDSGSGRTINPRYRDFSRATERGPVIAQPPPALYALGHTLSFGRDGDGEAFQLSSNMEVDTEGRWVPVDRDALIGLALADVSTLDPVKPSVMRMCVSSNAAGYLNTCVNGQPLPLAPVAEGGCLVARFIEAALVRDGVIIIEVALLDANGQRLPFRIDSLVVDQLSGSAGRADESERLGRLSVVSRKVRMNGLLAGSYSVEGSAESEFMWVRGKAHMLLRPPSERRVRIAGYIPFSMHKARNGVSDFAISAKIDGSTLKEIRVSEDQVFEFAIEVAHLRRRADGFVRLDFETSSELAATAEDQRELSYIVTKIAIE